MEADLKLDQGAVVTCKILHEFYDSLIIGIAV